MTEGCLTPRRSAHAGSSRHCRSVWSCADVHAPAPWREGRSVPGDARPGRAARPVADDGLGRRPGADRGGNPGIPGIPRLPERRGRSGARGRLRGRAGARVGALGSADHSRLRRALREGLGMGEGRFCDSPAHRHSGGEGSSASGPRQRRTDASRLAWTPAAARGRGSRAPSCRSARVEGAPVHAAAQDRPSRICRTEGPSSLSRFSMMASPRSTAVSRPSMSSPWYR